MTFAHPWLLLLLLLLPMLAWLKGLRGQPAAVVYSSTGLLRGLSHRRRSKAGALLAAFRWLVLALCVVAFARPQKIESETTIKASGVDIALVLDLSGSMAAEDFQLHGQRVNRLTLAKFVMREFIEKRSGDRLGLVAFAGRAYIAAPQTLDHAFLNENLDRLDFNSVKEDGTAIGSALTTALNRLRDLESKSKIVILMTDGQNNAGSVQPLTAAEAAQTLGIKVYTIGVGTHGTAPFPQRDMFGRKGYVQVPVDIDEDTLKEIASRTGGKYYRADRTETLERIYDEIDQLEKTDVEVKKYVRVQELFPWLLAAALGLMLAEVTLGNTVWKRLP
jgi:Ca-activated chloride channel family protein